MTISELKAVQTTLNTKPIQAGSRENRSAPEIGSNGHGDVIVQPTLNVPKIEDRMELPKTSFLSQASHPGFNQIARNVRGLDQSFKKISGQLQEMKRELTTLIKQYPPYPPGSEVRAETLERVNSLRRQIEQLDFPKSREQDASSVKTDISYATNLGTQKGTLVLEPIAGDGYMLSIRQVVNNTENKSEINLPEIPLDADDEKIAAFMKKINAVESTIKQKKMNFSIEIIKANENTEFSDIEAEAVSADVRSTLADGKGYSITQQPLHFLGFLG